MFYINPIDEFNNEIYSDDFLSFLYEEFNKSPDENIFYINFDYLLENSKTIQFDPKWDFNPFIAAQDVYGSKYYYKILLLVNSLPSFVYFNSNYLNGELKIVPLSILKNLMKTKI